LRRDRPRCRRAAEQRDELAPSLIELHSVPTSRIAGYRIGNGQSAGMRTSDSCPEGLVSISPNEHYRIELTVTLL
jgi:hypothetical protein